MKTRMMLLAAVVLPSIVSTAAAQFAFNPNIGSALNMSNNTMLADNDLGFDFMFPGGAIHSKIDIDSNGRILAPGGSGASDGTENVWELLAYQTSICVLWNDLDATPAQSDVYFNAYHDGVNNIAVITWQDVVESSQSTFFTVQLVLRDDNSFLMWWGPNTPMSDGIVGISEGNGAPDPGMSDFTCGPSLVTNGASTVYEDFAPGTFDLAGSWVWWSPDPIDGGYFVITPFYGACTLPLAPTQARQTGSGCGGFTPPPVAIDYVADGTGGYLVLDSTAVFDPNLGNTVGITGSDETAPITLGFDFTMPGGTVTDTLTVDSNGRLMTTGTSDPTPSLAEFFNQPGGIIAPCWGTFDVSNPASTGAIMFATNGTDYATVTWDGVAQFNGTIPHTMQVQIFGDAHPTAPNSWTFVYEDLGGLETRSITASNWFFGCSDGVGAGSPGEVDLSVRPFGTPSQPNVYEEFNWFAFDQWDLVTPSRQHLALSFDALPVIGTDFDLTLKHIAPTVSATWLLIGFRDVAVDLSSVGVPCNLYSSVDIPAQPMTWTAGQATASYSLPISGAPGIPLVLQSVVVNFGANPLNVELSNAVTAVTGF